MATQTDGAPSKISAEIVGCAFVEQFYSMLHQSPDLVYRFYQDCSTMSRPNPEGTLVTVTSMEKIKELILSLDCESYQAEILTADAQASHVDGVTVLVTGCLTGKDQVRRKFTELFFLAPQDNGYFVLNDVFRFLEEVSVPVVEEHVDRSASAALVSSDAPVQVLAESTEATNDSQENHKVVENKTSADELKLTAAGKTVSEPSVQSSNNAQPVVNTSDEPSVKSSNNAQPVVNTSDEPSVKSSNNPQCIVETSSNELSVKSSNNAQCVVETLSNGHVDVPKKTFAAVLANGKEAARTNIVHVPSTAKPAESTAQPMASPAATAATGATAIATAPASTPAASTGSYAPNGSNGSASSTDVVEGKDRSIYVGGLPSGATPQQVEQVFKKFGRIRRNGIQVRQNGQYCFGFVEFEDASARDKVVQVGTIEVDGYEASIEAKRTSAQVINGKTTYPNGRGGFHSDGPRRGNYARSDSGNGRRNGEGAPRDHRNGDGYVYQNGGGRGGSRDRRNGDGHVYQKGGGRGVSRQGSVT